MRKLAAGLNALLLVGCSQVLYEPMVFDGEQINKENLIEIAEIDENILDYAQDLYSDEPEEVSDSQVLIGSELELADHFKQDSNLSSFIDTKFLATYCDSRGGDVLNWMIDKEYEHLREGQVRKEFYTCEISGFVEAALLYDITFTGPFVKIDKRYMTTDEFEECRKKYVQLETDDGKITVDKKSLYDPAEGSKCRTCSQPFFVDLSNNGQSGQLGEIEKISIIIGAETHDAFIQNIGNIKIDNYDENYFEKGIERKEEIAVRIKGIEKYQTEDVLDSIIVINGHEYGNFKEVDPYQRDKRKFQAVPEYLAID